MWLLECPGLSPALSSRDFPMGSGSLERYPVVGVELSLGFRQSGHSQATAQGLIYYSERASVIMSTGS